jgi:predicted PhzF superfamily epimerase YddE/YHI9
MGKYWGEHFRKLELLAYQASARGGELQLKVLPDRNRILISGTAVTVLQGSLHISQ